MKHVIRIHPGDSVAVATGEISAGETLQAGALQITANEDIPFGHKIALRTINKGEAVVKYGFPIGHATTKIEAGSHVHGHNLKTNLEQKIEYRYAPSFPKARYNTKLLSGETFEGYIREDGRAGIRNEIWILPTVGCVNKTAEQIARLANERFSGMCDGFFAFTHPYGCSQLGDDQLNTQRILAGLAEHPNASAVLLLGLGCENNGIEAMKKHLADPNSPRLRYLIVQDTSDELGDALALLEPLANRAAAEKKQSIPVEKLVVGFKCGGSDAFSGITANPLCGRITDRLTASGGRAILTEVPEMFGAETILMERCKDKGIFDKCVGMISGFKEYYLRHNQAVYENPSPGNKAGGITTLEEKSLGCIQKGGSSTVTDILEYGGRCSAPGLTLLTGPGNDMVSCTNLTAAGANLILFTTGRGTPFGAPVPTIKISTNTALYKRKQNWIDFNAGCILEGKSFEDAEEELLSLILDIASKRKTAKNEQNGYREIAVFKDGVTL